MHIIFIGDIHFQTTNIQNAELFTLKIVEYLSKNSPDIIILGGDLLHYHERLHTVPLNKCYELIQKLSRIAPLYILVGNHDLINNQQFLTENHWMNGLKEWKNVTIVDKVIYREFSKHSFVFTPYVPNGRFKEALNTIGDKWKSVNCIFAHQEFYGCKMGAIISTEGDKWDLKYPYIVSGHIHSKQQIQKNVYYSGSAMQHAFGESNKNIIASLNFPDEKSSYILDEIDLKLPRKRIVYLDSIEDVKNFKLKNNNRDDIKLTIKCSPSEFKTLKKCKEYKLLIKKNIKINFKNKPIENLNPGQSENINFLDILDQEVKKHNNSDLLEMYTTIIKNCS